mmetsp:Transcript_44673/g.83884  ORF Transcript_44673/g.83884 Transcript_44673/m.83884 type:complete len:273 (-) Transcript_44673:80-898(-)
MGNTEGGLCKPKPAPREIIPGDEPPSLCKPRKAASSHTPERDERSNEFDNDPEWSTQAAEKLANACTLPRRGKPERTVEREDSTQSEGIFNCAAGAKHLAADFDDFVKLHSKEQQSGTMEVASMDDLQDQYISQWAIDVRARGYDMKLRTHVVADTPTDMLVTQSKTGHCSLRSESTVPFDETHHDRHAELCSAKPASEKKKESRANDPERTPEIERAESSKAHDEERTEKTYNTDFAVPSWASFESENDAQKIIVDGRVAKGARPTGQIKE